MIMADPNTHLGFWCRQVATMKPGQKLDVDICDLRDIPSFVHNNTIFTAADRILENIMGSSFTHSYTVSPCRRTVTFCRHENTGKRHYESPDNKTRLDNLRMSGRAALKGGVK